jgi:hypothetical protein
VKRLFPAGLVAVTFVVSVALLGGCGGQSASAPDPQDVAAARACETVFRFSNGQVFGDAIIAALGGMQQAGSTVKQRRWQSLATEISAVVDDMNANNGPQMQSDIVRVVKDCGTLPAASKTAGGFR